MKQVQRRKRLAAISAAAARQQLLVAGGAAAYNALQGGKLRPPVETIPDDSEVDTASEAPSMRVGPHCHNGLATMQVGSLGPRGVPGR
jgi:hypothetical protein